MHVHSSWRSLCTCAASAHKLRFRPAHPRFDSFRDTGRDAVFSVLEGTVWRLVLLHDTNGDFLGKLPAGDYGCGLGEQLIGWWVFTEGKLVSPSFLERGTDLQDRCRLFTESDTVVSIQKSNLLTHTTPQLSHSCQFGGKPLPNQP